MWPDHCYAEGYNKSTCHCNSQTTLFIKTQRHKMPQNANISNQRVVPVISCGHVTSTFRDLRSTLITSKQRDTVPPSELSQCVRTFSQISIRSETGRLAHVLANSVCRNISSGLCVWCSYYRRSTEDLTKSKLANIKLLKHYRYMGQHKPHYKPVLVYITPFCIGIICKHYGWEQINLFACTNIVFFCTNSSQTVL